MDCDIRRLVMIAELTALNHFVDLRFKGTLQALQNALPIRSTLTLLRPPIDDDAAHAAIS